MSNTIKCGYSEFPRHPLEGKVLRLYRYLGSHWEDVFRDSRLKLSSVKSFNDIFDCKSLFCCETSEKSLQVFLQKCFFDEYFQQKVNAVVITQYLNKYFFEQRPFDIEEILCFSKDPTPESDILMWSHYANKWAGIRLGFDILFENHAELDYKGTTPYYLTPIKYRDDIPHFQLNAFDDYNSFSTSFGRFFIEVATSKSKAWGYENEWRLMATTEVSESAGEMRFWRFNRKLLKTIDLGPRMTDYEKSKVIKLADCFFPQAIVREVVPDCNFYKIRYNPTN